MGVGCGVVAGQIPPISSSSGTRLDAIAGVASIGSFFSVEECLCKGVVSNFKGGHLLVLVRSHGNKLCLWKRVCDNASMLRANSDQVYSGLVFMQRIQHYLAGSVRLVGELYFGKRNGLLHPMSAKVGGLGMDINWIRRRGFRFSAGHPFPVDIFPAMAVDLHELKKDRIHGGRIQTRRRDFDNGKHTPEMKWELIETLLVIVVEAILPVGGGADMREN